MSRRTADRARKRSARRTQETATRASRPTASAPATAAGRRAALVACAVCAVATLAIFGDVLAQGNRRILSSPNDDLARYFFHWWRFSFAELARGHLVLWNPHLYSGTPYFGAFQPALLYPPHWIHLVLPTAAAFNVEFALHLWIAGVGTYLWTAHRRLDPTGCVLAALVLMFCGAFFLQLYRGHVPNLCTMAWAPYVLLAIDGAVDADGDSLARLRWTLAGSAAVAMQILAGHVQYLFYTGIVAATYALLRLRAAPRRRPALASLVAIAGGGAGLAAVQLFTGLDAASESLRATLRYDIARTFAFPAENLLTVVAPDVFGNMLATPYWGRWTISETSVFVGAAAATLAVVGAIHGARDVRRFSGTMLLVALVLAVGYATPVYGLLYRWLPGFGSVRGTTKFTFLASLFGVMLVAIGFDHLRHVARVPRWPAIAAAVAAAILLGVGAVVRGACADNATGWQRLLSGVDFTEVGYTYFVQGRAPLSLQSCVTAERSLLWAGATFVVVAFLLTATLRDRRALYGVALLAVAEVFGYARGMRPSFDPAPLVAYEETYRANLRAHVEADARVLAANPNVGVAVGAADVWGTDPMVLGRYARFIGFTQGTEPDDFLTEPYLRRITSPFALVRLGYFFDMNGNKELQRWNVPYRLPRASLIREWRVVPTTDAMLAALADPAFDARRTVLLEQPPEPLPDANGAEGTVSLIDVSSDVIDVRAELPAPAILLISDNYSRGWKVRAPASAPQSYAILPADYMLRAIPLAAGSHRFRLDYRPAAFVVGAWVTLASLVTWGAALVVARSRRP